MITQKTIDEIFNTVEVEEVVGDFVHLKKRGANLLGLCPFHDEKTPSFTVSPTKNIYKCFGCGRGGNAVQFVMEHEQLNYPEALRYLATKYGIAIEETQRTEEEVARGQERESLYLINRFAQEHYEKLLFNTDYGKSIGLGYFRQRGFNEKTIKKFELGIAPAGGDEFTATATSQGYNIELLRKAGLTTEKNRDFFRNRVMFTIHNVSGKIVAFAGRSLTSDKRSPKYINSPESDIYNKSWTLYAMHLAKKSIATEDECILVEGYTDVISLHQQGLENVVASSGTSLTDGQIKLIKRYTNNVLILFDGDSAGIKAAMRGIDLLLGHDINIRIVVLPEGHDPDSFMSQEGIGGFKMHLEKNAQDFILFKSGLLMQEAKKDPIRKTALIRDIVSSIAKIPDLLKRSLYIQQCSERFDVKEEILIDTLNKELRAQSKKQGRFSEGQRQSSGRPAPTTPFKERKQVDLDSDEAQERDIIRILISLGHRKLTSMEDVTVADFILANIMEDIIETFDNPLYKSLLEEFAQLRSEDHDSLDHRFFVHHTNPEVARLAAEVLSDKYDYSDNWEKRWNILLNTQKEPDENFEADCQYAILRLKLRKINRLIKKNADSISTMTSQLEDEDQMNQIEQAMKIHSRLLEQRNQIAEMLKQVVI